MSIHYLSPQLSPVDTSLQDIGSHNPGTGFVLAAAFAVCAMIIPLVRFFKHR